MLATPRGKDGRHAWSWSGTPGDAQLPDGMPQRGKHESDVKWDRVPTRSVALLRLFFTLVVLTTAAVMIMVVHLHSPAA